MIGRYEDGREYRDTGWMGVQVSSDGRFKRNGYPIKTKTRHDGHLIVRCRVGGG